jgi:hypothetical protein
VAELQRQFVAELQRRFRATRDGLALPAHGLLD